MKLLIIAVMLLCSTAYAWDDDTILVDDGHGNIVPVEQKPWTIKQVGDKTVYNYGKGMTGINNSDGSQTWIYDND